MSARRTSTMPEASPVPVLGALSQNWDTYTSAPAIIVNPEAHPLALLAWCMGELQSLRRVVMELASYSEALEPNDINDMILHHLQPLPEVLEVAHAGFRRILRSDGG